MKLRKIIYAIAILLPLNAKAGEHCGSKIGVLNELASIFLIPEFFPPETELLKNLLSTADEERCSRLGPVYLGEACLDHDRCYIEKRGKIECDKTLQDRWIKACRAKYKELNADSISCRITCEYFVKIMSEAQRYDSQGFCPSCDSYQSSFKE